MVVFPAFSAFVTLLCAGVIARDAVARPRPDKIAWAVAFAIFAIAGGAEVVGSLGEWTPTLARIYYLTGAVLVVGYLALGELYLLAGRRIQRVAPGATLLLTAVAASVVWNAGIDDARLAEDGWEAIERGTALTALAIGVNSAGTAIIVGGLAYSAWRFKRLGTHRNRMIGCVLIALGTLTVGLGGTLTRLGHHEYLYIAMAAGAAIIFGGYLQTRRPDEIAVPRAASDKLATIGPRAATRSARSHGANGRHAAPAQVGAEDPGVAFIDAKLVSSDANALSELCRVWSVPAPDIEAFAREQARLAWALRQRLSPEGQARFDALPIPVRAQLTELHHEVFAPVERRPA